VDGLSDCETHLLTSTLHSGFNVLQPNNNLPKPLFLPHFWLVLAGFLGIQLTYNHLQDNEFSLVVRLKFQIA
jgi:hypothetical protein